MDKLFCFWNCGLDYFSDGLYSAHGLKVAKSHSKTVALRLGNLTMGGHLTAFFHRRRRAALGQDRTAEETIFLCLDFYWTKTAFLNNLGALQKYRLSLTCNGLFNDRLKLQWH